jgi:hypothetical protein
MLPLSLSPDDVRALARMARGGVYLDPEGHGLLAGRPVIERRTVRALADAHLVELDDAARRARLTGAGHAALARMRSADVEAP